MRGNGWNDYGDPVELEVVVPPQLLRVMKEGYILWFYDNFRTRRERTKEGEQFWIEDGVLCTKTVRMFKSKDITSGQDAIRTFKRQLEQYGRSDYQIRLGEIEFRMMNIDRLEKTLEEEMRKKFQIPFLPATHSYYDFIDEMSPMMAMSFHKKKVVKENAFDAKKAKVAVFNWILKKNPKAIMVPEFGIGGEGVWSKSSVVDMAAFDEKKIIFIEIKAENDTFVRLAKQLETSALSADEVWLAIYEAKSVPKEIDERVGLISFSKNGKHKIMRKPTLYKHKGGWLGHIWSSEWQDSIRSIKGANQWLTKQKDGHDGYCGLAQSILKSKARQFTIDMWRSRFQVEFLWRRDNALRGETDAIFAKRGMNNNLYEEHFRKKYDSRTDKILMPKMVNFVKEGYTFPEIKKKIKKTF